MVVEVEEKEGEVMAKHVIGGMSDLVIPEEDPIICDSFLDTKESE